MKQRSWFGFLIFTTILSYQALAYGAATLPADLSVSIVAGGATVDAGETFTYEIEVTNLGEVIATDTVLGVDLPSQGELVSASFAGTNCVEVPANPLRLLCSLGSVDPLEVVDVSVVWQAPNIGTTLTLSVDAETSEVEPIVDNNTASIQTDVLPPAEGGCSLSPTSMPFGQGVSFLGVMIVSLLIFRRKISKR